MSTVRAHSCATPSPLRLSRGAPGEALPLLLCLAFALPLAADQRELASPHFVVRYQPRDAESALAVRNMAEQSFFRLADELGYEPRRKIVIILCTNHREFEREAGGRMGMWVQGLAFSGQPRLLLKARVGRERLKRVLVHELCHVFLGLRMAAAGVQVPRWFDEGIAKYVSGDWQPEEERLLAEATIRGEILGIAQLQAHFPSHPEKATLAYAESYALVKFLAEHDPATDLPRILDEFQATGSLNRAVRRTWHVDLPTAEQQWRRTLRTVYVPRGARLDLNLAVFFAMALLVIAAYFLGKRRRRREEEEPPSYEEQPPRDSLDEPDDVFSRRRRHQADRRWRE